MDLVQFLTMIGDNVIYFQIALLITLVLMAQGAYQPFNKVSLSITGMLLFSLIVKRVLLRCYEILVAIQWKTARTLEDFADLFTLNMSMIGARLDDLKSDNTLIGLTIVTSVILVHVYMLHKKIKKERIEYVIPQYSDVYDTTYTAERMMSDSTFESVKVLPSFQAAVMGSLDGLTYHMIGQCFRVDEGIVTAAHVVEDFPYLCIFKDEEHKVNISADRFQIGDGDYACCRQVDDIVQKTGISQAKFARLAVQKNSGLSVNIVAMNRRSIGFLREHVQFGYVEYLGSTIKGFSGAPYYFGKTVFGMHIGSHKTNLGYDAAFLRSELKPSRIIRKDVGSISNEDSATWLEEQIDRFGDFTYVRSPYDPDVYKIKVGGQYHIVDEDVLGKLKIKGQKKQRVTQLDELDKCEVVLTSRMTDVIKESLTKELETETDPEVAMVKGLLSEWGRTSIVKDVKFTPEADKPEPTRMIPTNPPPVEELPLAPRNAMTFQDSGNLIRAPTVNVGAHGQEFPQVDVQKQGMPIYPQTGYVYQQPLEQYRMESRPLMPVQQNVVSPSTAKSRRARLRNRQVKNELAQYVQLYGPLNPGAQISPAQPTTTVGST
uniref:Peptidase S39 domain-containing protein n=1 Tax=Zeugodacus cucurbitae sobemovirus 2 TaxID=3159483 RepID=A0AAU7L0M3_9VIRU